MKLLLLWIINALTLLILSALLPGMHFSGLFSALVTVIILGLINALIRPLVLLLTLPINILTLGLFTLVINALMLSFASSIVKGFTIDSFGTALAAAFIMWVISFLSNWLVNSTKQA